METIKVYGKLITDERETVLNYDGETKVWLMDTTIPKHFRRAIKQGWTPLRQYVYEDGTVCGMALTAPERSITIRSVEKKKMSEKQMENLFDDEEE